MKFQLNHTDTATKARAATLTTDHGEIQTPIFMPVGTAGSVKGINQQQLETDINAQIILGNTYHLYLRPGIEILKEAGGLHKFIGWERPILTDSGGYQVYSLADRRKLTEEGAKFQSHIDGSRHLFTPENVMDIQRAIGADIIMAFDECTPYPCEYNYAKKSLQLTHNWLERCCKRFDETEGYYGYQQSLFPIVQGSVFKDLREKSAEFVAALNREGNAIGGLSVGEPHEDMYAMTELVCNILPADKPRYLMGVGTPMNILESIELGVDMFDCVMPTRNGRNGMLFTANGTINIKNKRWEKDFSPVDELITPLYSKAYLRHLMMAGEMLGSQLASLHNLKFYLWLVTEARFQIVNGTFSEWKSKMSLTLSNKL
ncbi:MAG: tRNA guanosine(34) transglycosylase Tgt [Bacteroidia bacterium]|nr:tRNA guanosine(34) transglycosylase Tgt [Bacteroidia bacterium]